ncbi:MAG: S-layer homology domain-containing protein [Oscillatoriales cyanobacterium]|nr:MAG: S-layer homology domain-containing protein [Oscillatoriales cyanobacterium]
MSKNKGQTVKIGLFAGIIALVIAIGAIAITPVKTLAQITSIEQIIDVNPTTYYYQALQVLVERYGCFAGYPDDTFRGNKNLTRYETAGNLNACMDRITGMNLIPPPTAGGGVTKQEVVMLKRVIDNLQDEVNLIQPVKPSSKPRI